MSKELFESLTDEEKDILSEAILEKQSSRKKKREALSSELQHLIYKGVHSLDPESKQLGTYLAYQSVERFFLKKATKYIEEGHSNLDEYLSELYIIISEKIMDYNPKYTLTTFLDPYVTSHFTMARDKNRGISDNRYFRDLGTYIVNAQDELKKMGLEDPTPLDISDFVRVKRNKKISVSTIEQWISAHNQTKSVEELIYMKDANVNHQPDLFLLKKEDMEEFYLALSKISKMSQELIFKEIEYIQKKSVVPTVKELFAEIMAGNYGLTFKEFSVLFNQAHNELKSVLREKPKRSRSLPLNNLIVEENNPYEDQEKSDFLTALEESIDDLLPIDDVDDDW